MRRDAEVVATGRFRLPVSQVAHAVIRDMITRMTQGASGGWHSRRVFLTACGLSTLGALSGCGIHLEHGAVTTTSPTPSSPPADPLAVPIRRLRRLAEAAAQVHSTAAGTGATASGTPDATGTTDPADFAHRVATLHLQQVRALEPASRATLAPTPRSRQTPPDRFTSQHLAALEGRGVSPDAIAALARSDTKHLPVLACLAAFQAAVALHLGETLTWRAAYTPDPAVARHLLTSVRPCVYALETVTARTPLRSRADLEATLHVMYAARSDLVAAAGASPAPPPADYRLPIEPTGPTSRRRLAQTMLNRVVTAAASQAPHGVGDVPTLGFVIRLWAQGTAEAWRMGVTPEPFPGLSV